MTSAGYGLPSFLQTLGNGQFFQHVPASSGDDESWLQDDGGMQANGFLYWVYEDWKYLVSLDTSTMEFCVTELPHSSGYSSFCVGETKDGTTCIVFSDDSDDLNIGVLMPTRGDDGVEKWVLDQIDLLDTELERVLRVGLEETRLLNDLVDEPSDLLVLAVCDGYVYLSTSEMYHDPQTPCWFLSLCLETVTLERLFRRTFDTPVHPYIMAWPPSLVGNFGSAWDGSGSDGLMVLWPQFGFQGRKEADDRRLRSTKRLRDPKNFRHTYTSKIVSDMVDMAHGLPYEARKSSGSVVMPLCYVDEQS
ncbi:hypothetical protein HU200_036461 [Digitaria exilis]|uniref:Uncharacterized protein n=1 Tax=Digitaria exilis TaxID=1010633 RepID=A0A835BGL9_9POAL|nr:hypothetical protein HU200_036461 [Digitaria exilis]